MVEILGWTALIVGFIIAGFGTIVPGLPGAVFAVAGALVFKLVFPGILSWATFSILVILSLISAAIDFFGGIFGAKWGGATKAGIVGAAIGGGIGILFGIPGLILGPFFGAVVGDLFAKRRDIAQLLKSGGGAAFGFIISLILRLIIFLAMVFVTMVGIIF